MNHYLFLDTEDNSLRWSEKLVRGKGVKGICLEQHEVEILKMIYTHKMMTSSMIHEMYLLYRPHANSRSISNRLTRLVNAKVLYQRKHTSFFNNVNFSFFYTVGEVGFYMLKDLNIPELQIKNSFYEPSRIRVPNLHNLYAIDTVHRLFVENQKRKEPYSLGIMRGDVHELFSNSRNAFAKEHRKRGDIPIIPDYVITKGNIVICFESDMATEKARQIQQKEKMYCRLKQTEAFQGKRVYVVYSVVDERRSGDVGDNNLSRARRIHSLKAAHSLSGEWPEGLEFYVTSSNEVIELILDLLLSTKYPLSSIYKKALLSEMSRNINEHYQQLNGWQVEQVNTSDLLVDKRKAENLPSPTYAMKLFTRKGTIKTLVYLAGEFGSVRTYQELQTISKLLSLTNETVFMQEYLPIEMVVGYLKTVDLTKEYFGFTPSLSIRLVNHEDEQKRGLELLTAYKKEWKGW
ncbi:hypothetical protein D7X33_20460 [Butyricicoccus sp. 1XD8-22]|nr:hypothetical protein D7X33_20460 [Butyricicoccus sp. 1XD8-22]